MHELEETGIWGFPKDSPNRTMVKTQYFRLRNIGHLQQSSRLSPGGRMTHNPNTKDYSQRVYNRLVTTVTNIPVLLHLGNPHSYSQSEGWWSEQMSNVRETSPTKCSKSSKYRGKKRRPNRRRKKMGKKLNVTYDLLLRSALCFKGASNYQPANKKKMC